MSVKHCIAIAFFIACIVNVIGNSNEYSVTVETNVGHLQGVKATDGNYSMFLGIPYAQVDISNPFGPSTPYPKFENIFEANDDSSLCPQVEEFNSTISGSLDCLRLNIFVPDNSNYKLPVLVLIHGGSFTSGAAGKFLYGPKYLVKHNVIFITLNYRLGPYGFMCLHTAKVPGNQGLKDQVLALRWIKQNIEAFGGDKDKITVVGESAGARSIDLHLQSPQEKLFNKAIIQSGSAFNPGWFPEPDLEAPIKIASALSFETNNVDEALSYISQINPHLVIAAVTQIGARFRLCKEKYFPDTEAFITDHPLQSSAPKANGMQILLGYNNQEMIASIANQNPESFRDIFSRQLLLSFDFDDNIVRNLEPIVRHFYIGEDDKSENVRLKIADFDSDMTYIYSTTRNIARYLNNGADRLYQYVFSYIGGRNFGRRRGNITIGGASHVDDRGYLYDIQLFPEEPTEKDQQIIDVMTTMWTNFAKYGDPTPVTTALLTTKWIPITLNSPYHYLEIDSTLETGMRHYQKRMAFWDLFYKSYAEFEIGFENDKNSSSQIVSSISLFITTILCIIVLM